MWMKKVLSVILLIFVVAFIGGCGGSGGNGTSSESGGTTKSISGYVIDDPVVGATIEVYDENGNLIAKKENATDETGYFDIELPVSISIGKVRAIKDNFELEAKVIDSEKKIVISPISLLRDKLIDEFGYEEAKKTFESLGIDDFVLSHESISKQIKLIDEIRHYLNMEGIPPSVFVKAVKEANSSALIKEISDTDNETFYLKCFNGKEVFPKKIMCVSSLPSGDYVVKWELDNSSYEGSFVEIPVEHSGTVKALVFDKDGNVVYRQSFNIHGIENVESEKTYVVDENNTILSSGNFSLTVQNALPEGTKLTLKVAKGTITDYFSVTSDEVYIIDSEKEPQKPVKVSIPLTDEEYRLARAGKLAVLKKDSEGEFILKGFLDTENKTYIVTVESFSKLQKIKIDDGEDFIDELKNNSLFYSWLLEAAPNDDVKKFLQDIKDNNVDSDILEKVLEGRFTGTDISAGRVVANLYNLKKALGRLWDSNGYPDYV